MLRWTREQERVAFFLFGSYSDSPCPDCGAVWTTRTSKNGQIRSLCLHNDGCAYEALVSKALTSKTRGRKGKR